MKSLKGSLLIASPEMPDDDFAETVVLLVEHAEDGAYGLTLNQPTDMTVKEAWAQNNDGPCRIEGLVYADGDELWQELVKRIHGEKTLSMLKIRHRPDDPSAN